jgi:hypothetical protein
MGGLSDGGNVMVESPQWFPVEHHALEHWASAAAVTSNGMRMERGG